MINILAGKSVLQKFWAVKKAAKIMPGETN